MGYMSSSYCQRLTHIREEMSKHIRCFLLDIISYPWSNFNGGLANPPLGLGINM